MKFWLITFIDAGNCEIVQVEIPHSECCNSVEALADAFYRARKTHGYMVDSDTAKISIEMITR